MVRTSAVNDQMAVTCTFVHRYKGGGGGMCRQGIYVYCMCVFPWILCGLQFVLERYRIKVGDAQIDYSIFFP